MNANALPSSARNSTHLARTAAAVALGLVFALAIIATPAAQAQTYTVIHNFTNGWDGGILYAGLTIDAAGDLYGTTWTGGVPYDAGIVFVLRRFGSGWVFTPLYDFAGSKGSGLGDGAGPYGRVALASDGTLFGTTWNGGGSGCNAQGCGTVVHLRPSPTVPQAALAPWNETVLYRFTGGSDGGYPEGDLTFDQSGNIYGTTSGGGSEGRGVVYELKPSAASWTETVLHSFQGTGDGGLSFGGVVFDGSGRLYGVTYGGGSVGYGVVYQLSPSESGWTEQIIYNFTCGSDGGYAASGLTIDSSGNLFGTTTGCGSGGGGTVFELAPANGGWTFKTLYGFSGNGGGPWGKLIMDAAGNLYGTTETDGAYGWGSVFKLAPSDSGWTYTSLHDFAGGSDGGAPKSTLVFDANGNLYGTTMLGGTVCCGVVFEITP